MTLAHIYAVERGSYSDYRVVAVFDNKEAADLFAERINLDDDDKWDQASVAEWGLLSEAPTRTTVYCYQMSPSEGIKQWTYGEWSHEVDTQFCVQEWDNGAVLSRARTEDEARKAAHDRLAEMAARKAGIA